MAEKSRRIAASITLLLVLVLSLVGVLPSVQANAENPLMPMLVAKDGHPTWGTDPRQDSNIVYYSGRTHFAYESSEGMGYTETFPGPSGTGGYIKVISFDYATNQWLGPFTVSDKPVYDNHGYPVLTVDSNGYLHIVYDGHQIPLKYKRSLRPNDASEWTSAEQLGQIGTYPHLFVNAQNTLFLFYRERGGYDRWTEVMQTKPVGGSWSAATTILDAEWKNTLDNNFGVFVPSVCLGLDNAIYITWIWQDDRDNLSEISYGVGFAKSVDFGQTWTRADGTPYTLPIKRSDNQEKLWNGVYPNYSPTSIAANAQGQVVVLLSNFNSDWSSPVIYERLWSGSWSNVTVANGLLFPNIMIDGNGVARGLTMRYANGSITYMEAKPPYTTWTFTDTGAPTGSYVPTVLSRASGTFEGTWHTRVASDHSDLYWYQSLIPRRR
jgi:hypothetical protein